MEWICVQNQPPNAATHESTPSMPVDRSTSRLIRLLQGTDTSSRPGHRRPVAPGSQRTPKTVPPCHLCRSFRFENVRTEERWQSRRHTEVQPSGCRIRMSAIGMLLGVQKKKHFWLHPPRCKPRAQSQESSNAVAASDRRGRSPAHAPRHPQRTW